MCHDTELNEFFHAGQKWETKHPDSGQLMDCVCNDLGNSVRVDCSTGNRCNDHGES
jgi:hypothetical protein